MGAIALVLTLLVLFKYLLLPRYPVPGKYQSALFLLFCGLYISALWHDWAFSLPIRAVQWLVGGFCLFTLLQEAMSRLARQKSH